MAIQHFHAAPEMNLPHTAAAVTAPDTRIFIAEDAEYARPDGVAFAPPGDRNAVIGFTSFGRNSQIHDLLIHYFTMLKDKGHTPEGGHHVFFPATSVGCEAYYFAMRAKEAGLLENGSLTIHATDLQSQFVKYAQRGLYPEKTLVNLEKPFWKYFKRMPDGQMQLSPEIMNAVTFHPAGDICNIAENAPDVKYDAVIFPHVIYHYQREAQREALLSSLFSLSRGLVITDDTSFEENRRLYEKTMLTHGFGEVTKETGYKPLHLIRSLSFSERNIPFVSEKPITDIAEVGENGYYAAIHSPEN